MEMQVPEPEKAWFLYLMTERRICRLNIDRFCESRNSPKPRRFEVVHDYYADEDEYTPSSTIPLGMSPIVVDSKVYLLGGKSTKTCQPESNDDDSVDGEIHDSDNRKKVRRRDNSRVPILDVFAFDPDASEGPTISLSDGRTIPRRIIDPRLVDPQTLSGPIVFTLENKTYAMANVKYSGEEEDINHQPPLSRFLIPLNNSGKSSPVPPQCDDNHSSSNHCTWGHNFVISYWNRGVYLFDTRQEKWQHWPEEQNNRPAVFRAVVEFEGFLIGVKTWDSELAVYQLDSKGIPKMIRALDELHGIFCPFIRVRNCCMGKCHGGRRLWLAYAGKHGYVRVAVFQVFISYDLDGNAIISTELEAAEFYCLGGRGSYPIFYSAFSMCHDSNNREIEEKNVCGTIIAHDHR